MIKKGLDEMQLQRKNKIGNQSFLMLIYLLLLDTGLYGFGFTWVSYPANIILILTICSAIYVIRLMKSNAYVGPYTEGKGVFKTVLTVIIAIIVAMASIVVLKDSNFNFSSNQIDDIAAPILLITALVALIIAGIVSIIKKIQNKH